MVASLVETASGLVLRTSSLSSSVLDFDSVALAEGGEQRLANGFGGFAWSQAGVYNPDGAIPGYVAASGQNIAFIAEAANNEVAGYEDAAAGSALTLTRDAPFSLTSARFTAAFRDDVTITVRAYADQDGTQVIGQKTFTVDRGALDLIDFTAGLDFGSFNGAARVEVNGNDGDAATADYFGLDDLTFTTGTETDRAVTRLGFDDLGLAPGGETPIADGYLGFDWSQIGAYRPDGALPGYATASGDSIAFIAEANNSEVAGYEDAAAGSAAVISRADAFEFVGASFSAAFRDDLDIVIRGYADEAGQELVAEVTITADRGTAQAFTFLDGAFADIRRLEFNANDTNAATSDYFGFDDLLIA